MDNRFQHDRFLIDEKHFTIGDKHHVYDESGAPLFYVERDRFKAYANVHVYDGEQKGRELLLIEDKSVFDLNATMKVSEPGGGQELGSFKRVLPASFWRSTWSLRDPSGHVIGSAREASLARALLRRMLSRKRYTLFPFKTDFVIEVDGRQAGMFLRRHTIQDRYVLDLREDTGRALDRRLALALGILLDSAERR